MIYWDPPREIFSLPFFDFPILWYGALFAFGFWIALFLFIRIVSRYFQFSELLDAFSAKIRAREISDRLVLYIILGTLLGARLGHFLFYESPSEYLADPLEFFRFRNGGLASHGAVVGIMIATVFFSARIRKQYPSLDSIRILDFMSVPAMLTSCCIRIGNFVNQEILGTPSNLPWAVVFGHPADGSLPLARHPVQLYEAAGYLIIFFILLFLTQKPSFFLAKGRTVGLLLGLVFSLRLLVEKWKVEQSDLIHFEWVTMGQVLSVPMIVLGLFLLFRPIQK